MSQTTAPQAPERKLNLGRLERIQRLLQYGAAAVLLVFVVLIFVAATQLRVITKKVASANSELSKLTENINALKGDIDALAAQKKTLQTQVDVQGNVLSTVRAKDEQAKEIIDEAYKQSSEAVVGAAPAQLMPLVYIQIGRPDQSQKAREVAAQLKGKGYNVPGVENVGARAAGKSNVRYCEGDAASKDVADITRLLAAAGVSLAPRPLGAGMCARIRPRQYELWFGEDFPPGRSPAPDTDNRPLLPGHDRPGNIAPANTNRQTPTLNRNYNRRP